MDRCAADAMTVVTGVRLGRRSLKFMGYGIMAATFLNLETEKAYRLISTESSRELAAAYAPEIADPAKRQTIAYRRMPDSALFRAQRVRVRPDPCDLPGPTRRKVVCAACGQVVRDRREVMRDGLPICRPCADGCYFTDAREARLDQMEWIPDVPPLAPETPVRIGAMG